MESLTPALEGGVLITGQPGKSLDSDSLPDLHLGAKDSLRVQIRSWVQESVLWSLSQCLWKLCEIKVTHSSMSGAWLVLLSVLSSLCGQVTPEDTWSRVAYVRYTFLDSWTGRQLISHGCEARLPSPPLAARAGSQTVPSWRVAVPGPSRGHCACEEGSFPLRGADSTWPFLSSYCKFEDFWVPAFSLMHHTFGTLLVFPLDHKRI